MEDFLKLNGNPFSASVVRVKINNKRRKFEQLVKTRKDALDLS